MAPRTARRSPSTCERLAKRGGRTSLSAPTKKPWLSIGNQDDWKLMSIAVTGPNCAAQCWSGALPAPMSTERSFPPSPNPLCSVGAFGPKSRRSSWQCRPSFGGAGEEQSSRKRIACMTAAHLYSASWFRQKPARSRTSTSGASTSKSRHPISLFMAQCDPPAPAERCAAQPSAAKHLFVVPSVLYPSRMRHSDCRSARIIAAAASTSSSPRVGG